MGAAIIALVIVAVYRGVVPEKSRWWQLLIPAVLAGAAFGLDWLVETDREKIQALIKVAMRAAEREDAQMLGTMISDDYSDSCHKNKTSVMSYCRRMLSAPLIEKNKKIALSIVIDKNKAVATLTVKTSFDEQSYVHQYQPFILIKIKLNFINEKGQRWLVRRAEVLEINRNTVNWKDIQ